VGQLAFEATFARDYQVIQGIVLMFCVFFVAANFLADILYAYLDPRIRYQ
jgi:peptide/nickel transport system permease protein